MGEAGSASVFCAVAESFSCTTACDARENPGQNDFDAHGICADIDMRRHLLHQSDDADLRDIACPSDIGMGEFIDIGAFELIEFERDALSCLVLRQAHAAR